MDEKGIQEAKSRWNEWVASLSREEAATLLQALQNRIPKKNS